ncbi:MAG: purine-nucleoside phosphorylase [Anaerolineae bacterium]|nr:MAG: purine-nucleoside phosphorylase [Anaerolineae bacterium]
MPEHCVITFFKDVMEEVAAERQAIQLVENRWEDGPHPVYEIQHNGQRLAYMHGGIGASLSAALLEEVIGFGCRKFIVCGGCGVLDAGVDVGALTIVKDAVRDEGVSYHYLPPGRTVAAHPAGVAALEAELERRGVPHRIARTWTTAAPYRETPGKIAARRDEGCVTVEMEAAGLLAVAQFRGVPLGCVLYGGDDLSGAEWDNRDWQSKGDVRRRLFWLAADACLAL